MTSTWALSIVLAGLAGAAAAQGLPGETYVQLNAGYGSGDVGIRGVDSVLGPLELDEKLRDGGFGGALIGHVLPGGVVSVEGEGVYADNRLDAPDINAAFGADLGLRLRSYGGLVNLKLEAPKAFDLSHAIGLAPYVAVGGGYGRSDLAILGDHYAGTGGMWQIKAGLALHTGRHFTWDLGYRYFEPAAYTTNKLGLNVRVHPDLNVLTLGLRYRFGAGT